MEASTSTMNKTAMHVSRTPLGETLHTHKLYSVVTQTFTLFSSFYCLSPLLLKKLQLFSGIPQTPTPQSLLDSQPKSNTSKYLHPSSKQQLPADSLCNRFLFSASPMATGLCPWYVLPSPSPRKDSFSHSLHLMNDST